MRNEIICWRNGAAKAVAAKCALDYIDLYALFSDADGSLWRDPFHLQQAGYEKIAQVVSDYIRKNI